MTEWPIKVTEQQTCIYGLDDCYCLHPPRQGGGEEEAKLCACGGVLCDTCSKCENNPYTEGCADCDA